MKKNPIAKVSPSMKYGGMSDTKMKSKDMKTKMKSGGMTKSKMKMGGASKSKMK